MVYGPGLLSVEYYTRFTIITCQPFTTSFPDQNGWQQTLCREVGTPHIPAAGAAVCFFDPMGRETPQKQKILYFSTKPASLKPI